MPGLKTKLNLVSVSLIDVCDTNEELLTSINYTAQACSISNIVGGFYLFQNYSNAVISDRGETEPWKKISVKKSHDTIPLNYIIHDL
jgi:hypothetical protein